MDFVGSTAKTVIFQVPAFDQNENKIAKRTFRLQYCKSSNLGKQMLQKSQSTCCCAVSSPKLSTNGLGSMYLKKVKCIVYVTETYMYIKFFLSLMVQQVCVYFQYLLPKDTMKLYCYRLLMASQSIISLFLISHRPTCNIVTGCN